MGAYHARKPRPTTTVYPEVTRYHVKLSRRWYLKKRPRIAVVCPLCVPHHTGFLLGRVQQCLAAALERNKQEKSPAQTAQERTDEREDRHTRNNKEGSPKTKRAAPNTKTIQQNIF